MVFWSLIVLATIICCQKSEAVFNVHYTACATGNNICGQGNTSCAEEAEISVLCCHLSYVQSPLQGLAHSAWLCSILSQLNKV